MENWKRLLASLVFLVPSCAWSGFVLSLIWAWFVVPLGVVEIGTWHGAGIVTMCWYLCKPVKTEPEEWTTAMAREALAPAAVLGVGALLHWFMVL